MEAAPIYAGSGFGRVKPDQTVRAGGSVRLCGRKKWRRKSIAASHGASMRPAGMGSDRSGVMSCEVAGVVRSMRLW
jgi:hypothetical protein